MLIELIGYMKVVIFILIFIVKVFSVKLGVGESRRPLQYKQSTCIASVSVC